MRLLWVALICLLAAPTTQACSLVYDEFTSADLSGNKVLTNLGHDGIVIDLGTGRQTTVSQDFMPTQLLAGSTPYVLHSGQRGLGADCSGTRYFEATTASGTQMHEWGEVLAFATDGNKFVRMTSSGVYLATLGEWTQSTKIMSTPSSTDYVRLSLNIEDNRLALSRADGTVTIHDLSTGKQLHKLDGFGSASWNGLLAWHEESVVVGRQMDDVTKFWFVNTETNDRREFSLTREGWSSPTLATGAQALLHFGDDVIRVTPTGSQRLKVPSGLTPSAVGADENGAIILFIDDEFSAKGILKIGKSGSLGSWYTEDSQGKWIASARPAFAWENGPDPKVTEGEPTLEESPLGLPILLAAIAAALIVRRRHA